MQIKVINLKYLDELGQAVEEMIKEATAKEAAEMKKEAGIEEEPEACTCEKCTRNRELVNADLDDILTEEGFLVKAALAFVDSKQSNEVAYDTLSFFNTLLALKKDIGMKIMHHEDFEDQTELTLCTGFTLGYAKAAYDMVKGISRLEEIACQFERLCHERFENEEKAREQAKEKAE